MESLPLMLQATLLCWVVLSLSIPVGDRHHCRVRCPWSDFVQCSVLPSHRCCGVNLRELPISTPWASAIHRPIDLPRSVYVLFVECSNLHEVPADGWNNTARRSATQITTNATTYHLALPNLDLAVVVDCFNIFGNCVVVDNRRVTTVSRGSGQLAGISATCILRAFSRFSSTEPTPTVIWDVLQRYKRVFPPRVDLRCLPFPFVMSSIHHLFTGKERMSLD